MVAAGTGFGIGGFAHIDFFFDRIVCVLCMRSRTCFLLVSSKVCPDLFNEVDMHVGKIKLSFRFWLQVFEGKAQ